ncbi:MAG: ATP-binding protein [Pyrinomonadaceae bacterium]
MAIEVFDIDDDQFNKILYYHEGHFLDLKRKEITPSKLTNTISAFANADGGELYIGIAESSASLWHTWDGFADPEDANAHIAEFEKLFPLGHDYSYNFLRHAGSTGFVLQASIRKTKGVVNAGDGVPRLRRNAQNLPVDTPAKLALLERNKGITSFENELVNTDITTISNSETVLRFILEVVPASEPETWLRKNELIKEGKPTVAGVMLFADLPQALLPKRTGIKIYQYQTSDEEGERDTLIGNPISIEGGAYDLITEAVSKTQEIIGNVKVIGTKGVLEPVIYPAETLHEVITNAVLHRDYSIADDVHVRIFNNRVEVESPGRLPAHMTPNNLLRERFARNGNIVRVINKFPNPPNKDVGEGLNTAVNAMRALRLKDPIWFEKANSFVVQINHQKLATPDTLIMEYLGNNPFITNRTARQLTGIKSENSMKNVFYRMRDNRMIEPVPGRSGFGSAWQKVAGA